MACKKNLPDAKEEISAAKRREVLVALLDKHKAKDTKTILDFGCGKGGLISVLSDSDLTIVGVDIDEDSLSKAKLLVRDKDNVTLEKGSMDAKAIKDHSFDAVVISEVLEHLDDPEDCLRFFSDILKEGKLLFILVPYLWELINCPRDAFINRALFNVRSDNNFGWEAMLFRVKRVQGKKIVRPRKYLRFVKDNFHDRYNLNDYVEAYINKSIAYTYHKQWFNYQMLRDMLARNCFSVLELKYIMNRRYMYVVARKTGHFRN